MSAISSVKGAFRPVGRFVRWLGPAWLAALVALIASIPLTLAAMGVNYAVASVDRGALRQHVAEAFASGQMQVEYWKPSEIDRGGNPFNDCYILHLALRDDFGAWERALAPRVNKVDENPCGALRTLAETPDVALTQRATSYAQYLHGQTFLGAAIVSAMPLDAARKVMTIVTFAVLGGLLGFAVYRFWKSSKIGRATEASTAGFVAIAATMLLLFYDEASFSMSPGHFPEDMVMFGYLWLALLVDPSRWSVRFNIAVHAVLGVLTAWLELLTGGIPLTACLIAFIFAAQGFGPNATEQLRRFFVAGAAFVAAMAGAFAFKILLTVQALGPDAWTAFSDGLQNRMAGSGVESDSASGKPLGIIYAWQEMSWVAAKVGLGSRELGRLMIGGSFLAVAYGVFVMWRRKMWGEQLIQPGLLITGFMAIVLWHVAFFPHSSVHASFMVRTLVGLYFTSAALIFCLHREQFAGLAKRAAAMLAPQRP